MFDRFAPVDIFRAHWKALSDYRETKPVPDIWARTTVVAAPLLAVAGTLVFEVHLRAPEGILAALALLAGGFLTAFTHLSSIRVELANREATWGDAERFDRDAIDETSAHLLAGSYVSGVAAMWLVLALSVGPAPDPISAPEVLTGVWAAVAAGLLVYVGVIFLVTLPRLYQAYAVYARVRKELNGTHRGY